MTSKPSPTAAAAQVANRVGAALHISSDASKNNSNAADDGQPQEQKIIPITSIPRQSAFTPFPGFTPDSAEAARKVLDDNHSRFHIYFNTHGFHNHFSHHVLASLAMGLPASGFEPIYAKEKHEYLHESFEYNRKARVVSVSDAQQRKSLKGLGEHGGVVERITLDNWTGHLDERAYYWTYLEFFQSYLDAHGPTKTLEAFVFSEKANQKGINMLARLLSGLVHPFIHVGYGLEFGINGILAEGLAMAVLTEPAQAAVLGGPSAPLPGLSPSNDRGLSLFSILELLAQEQALTGTKDVGPAKRSALLHEKGYYDLYRITEDDARDPDPLTGEGGWKNKWSELAWWSALFIGAITKPGGKLLSDFVYMHFNNAALFLPAYMPYLTPAARAQLFHIFFRVVLNRWVDRGAGRFYIDSTLYASTAQPHNPHKSTTDFGSAALMSSGHASFNKPKNAGVSPWIDLVEAASVHPDEHLTKAIRALAYFASQLASTPAGFALDALRRDEQGIKAFAHNAGITTPPGSKDAQTVLQGLEQLDGTAFVRAAGQMFEVHSWKREDVEMRWTREDP